MDPEYTSEYASVDDWHWWFRGRRAVIGAVLESLVDRGRPQPTILDLGCGPGGMLELLGRFGRVTGADSSGEAVRIARARGLADVVAVDGESLPFDDASFDVVCLFDVLEHVDDDVALAAEARRVTAPTGIVVVTVPAVPWLWGPQDVVSHHRRRYTRGALRCVLQDARLEIVRLGGFNSLLFPPIALVRGLGRLRRPSEVRSDFGRNAPGPANELLARIFAAEAPLVSRIDVPFGVSLLAVARPRAVE